MRYLIVVISTLLVFLLLSSTCRGDSLSINASVADRSVPSYGIDLEKNFGIGYLDLQNMVTSDRLSSTTTLAVGLELYNINGGILAGYNVQGSQVSPLVGLELGFTAPITKVLFLKENNQVTKQFGGDTIIGAITLGLGIEL